MYIDIYDAPVAVAQQSKITPAEQWVLAMQANPHLIRNWYAEMRLMSFEGQWMPLALGQPKAEQTYLASATHGYIDYARDELDLIRDEKTRRWSARTLAVAEPWMKSLQLDTAVSINAWCVSTHLYPNWNQDQIFALTAQLSEAFPHRPLWMRTLNAYQQSPLMDALRDEGWLLFPHRQVYVFDHRDQIALLTKRNNQLDQKLLNSTPLKLCQHEDFRPEDAEVMAELYDLLYLQKHSRWNAIYTPAYFRQALAHRWLEFIGFRDDQGKLVAFIGLYADHTSITTPMLGYDTQLPQTLGLYRLLMAAVLRLSLERQHVLNFGAGSASFKKMRGGRPEIEWQAFYVKHLNPIKRVQMALTSWAMRETIPSFLAKQAV